MESPESVAVQSGIRVAIHHRATAVRPTAPSGERLLETVLDLQGVNHLQAEQPPQFTNRATASSEPALSGPDVPTWYDTKTLAAFMIGCASLGVIQRPGVEVDRAAHRTSRIHWDRPDLDPGWTGTAYSRRGTCHPGGSAVAQRQDARAFGLCNLSGRRAPGRFRCLFPGLLAR